MTKKRKVRSMVLFVGDHRSDVYVRVQRVVFGKEKRLKKLKKKQRKKLSKKRRNV